MAVLFLTDGRFEGNGFLCDTQDLADLLDRHVEFFGDLLCGRVSAVLVQELAVGLLDLVDGLDHMDRDPDGTGLVRDGTRYCLTDPPRGIGRELEALGVIELIHGFYQPEVALLDEVEELHAAADVPLRDTDDETQVRLGEFLLRLFIALRNTDGEFDLLFRSQQRDAADLFEIDFDRIVHRRILGGVGGVDLAGLLGPADHVKVQRVEGCIAKVVNDLDVVALEGVIEFIQLIDLEVEFDDGLIDVVRAQFACRTTLFNKAIDYLLLLFFHKTNSLLFREKFPKFFVCDLSAGSGGLLFFRGL